MVVLVERPELHLTFVDRRERACDALRRAVRALGAANRAQVVHADLESLGHDPDWRAQFDAATARGVAAPPEVAELVLPLVRPGGVLVVSAAGAGEAWPSDGLARLDAALVGRTTEGLVVVRAGHCPAEFPRRRRVPALFDDARHPVEELAPGARGYVVLARTPFYAESGGQVGDTGLIKVQGVTLRVSDTVKLFDMVLHKCALIDGLLTKESLQKAVGTVDMEARAAAVRNHSATHLLHAALRQVQIGRAHV